MKAFSIVGAFALPLAVAACGEPAATVQNQQGAIGANSPAEDGRPIHAGQGNVTVIAGDQVSIAHRPIESLGWPAMTMAFRAPATRMIEGIAVGDAVAFQFRESDGGYELTSISKR